MQNELTFRQIVDGIAALFAVLTPDGAVEDVNAEVLHYFGKTLEELKGWGSSDAVHPDDLPRATAVMGRSIETGNPYDVELRQRRADGVYRWFHVQGLPVRDAQGRIIRWCILQTDIDERKRAEEALRESERELRQLIDSVPAMIAVAGADGHRQYVNKRAIDYLDTTHEGFREGALAIVHPDDRELLAGEWLRCSTTGEPMDLVHRVRRVDGVYRWVHVRGEPLLDEAGRIARWYYVFTDVDDQRKAEEALRSTRRKLSVARQIATVAELSASIAHEINQPLASAVTNAHACQAWLSHQPPNLERAGVTLDRIIRDGHSAADVVRRIRALFKEAAPVKSLLDVNQVIAEMLGLLSEELRDNGVVVDTELAADLPMIEADQVQIQQVLINLVHNAMEAMSAVTDGARPVVLRTRRNADAVQIEVRDHGAGVSDQALIFESFFTTKSTGMGMGLAISRSIVEAHGGRIWAAANDDGGMSFSVTLPIPAPATA